MKASCKFIFASCPCRLEVRWDTTFVGFYNNNNINLLTISSVWVSYVWYWSLWKINVHLYRCTMVEVKSLLKFHQYEQNIIELFVFRFCYQEKRLIMFSWKQFGILEAEWIPVAAPVINSKVIFVASLDGSRGECDVIVSNGNEECDDAESIVVASSIVSDGFSTAASSRNIPFCVSISGV